jgi:predicted FMN-binding regulatory protein PaiB
MRFFVANMKRAYGTVELTDKERKARAILDKLQQLGGRAKHDEVKQPIKRTVPSKEASELIKELIGCNQLREVIDGRSKLIELVKK